MSPAVQLTGQPEREFSFSDEQFRFLAELANSKTGIVLADNKRDMIYGRLVRRLRALNLSSFADYCALMASPAGEAELGQFINAVTTNLTRFFRETHHFEALRAQLTALLGKRVPDLRIWSAGCSSGMEPYSISMVLAEARGTRQLDARILATDIDTAMLETGRRGLYGGMPDLRDVPEAMQKYFIRKDADTVQMPDRLRDLITFNHLNLLQDWPMQRQFDAIFCRNVVIYFDKPTKQRLFERMAERLKPDGLLYIGHSENLNGICDRFQLIGRTIYRRVR